MTVYIFQAGGSDGPVKIGHSDASVTSRRHSVQTGAIDQLVLLREMPGRRTAEAWLHRKFKANHIRGEWFELHPDMLTIEIPAALSEADGSPPKKDKDEADLEAAACAYHIKCATKELSIPRHIAARHALLLSAYENGSKFLSLLKDVAARLESARARGSNEAAEKYEEQYVSLYRVWQRWDDEIHRLEAEEADEQAVEVTK